MIVAGWISGSRQPAKRRKIGALLLNTMGRGQRGFLLLEVLMALTILSCGIIGVVKAYSISLRAQRHSQYQTAAFLLASGLQEQVEAGIIEELDGRTLVGTELFEWNVEVKPSYAEEFKLVEVDVSWVERSKKHEIVLSNLYAADFANEVFRER